MNEIIRHFYVLYFIDPKALKYYIERQYEYHNYPEEFRAIFKNPIVAKCMGLDDG